MMYAPAPVPVQPLDLYAMAKAKAWRSMWIGVGLFFGGIVVGVLGFVTGFLVFIALFMVVGGFVKFCTALGQATDPTKRLIHLGNDQIVRRQAFRAAEQELNDPRAQRIMTTNGVAAVGYGWAMYQDAEQVVLFRREDVVWYYVVQKKNKRNIRIQIRTGLTFELEDVSVSEHPILQSLAFASPCAFAGFDPRVASLGLPRMVYEVDQRRAYSMPGAPGY